MQPESPCGLKEAIRHLATLPSADPSQVLLSAHVFTKTGSFPSVQQSESYLNIWLLLTIRFQGRSAAFR